MKQIQLDVVEHVELLKDNRISFDFLGKDSIRYQNEVLVEEKVYKNLKEFMKGKKKSDSLFDLLNTASLNIYLKSWMEKLTAKVFRTYNASIVLDEQLSNKIKKTLSVNEKVALYNDANRQVAILCNHQRTVPKTFSNQLERIDKQLDDLKDYIKILEETKKIIKKNFEKAESDWEKRLDKLQKISEKEEEEFEELLSKYEIDKKNGLPDLIKPTKPKKFIRKKMPKDFDSIEKEIEKSNEKLKDLEINKKVKDDNKTVALGTSKINYCDPRISISWCKRNEVPITKIFNKSLIQKFPWAMDADDDYKF